MLRQLFGLRAVSQIIYGNAAAEIDVLEREAGLAMNGHQVVPHAPEGFRKRLDIRRLRTNMNVNSTNVNQLRMLQPTTKSFQHFRCRDAKLGSQQRRLQTKMRARADLRHQPQRNARRW